MCFTFVLILVSVLAGSFAELTPIQCGSSWCNGERFCNTDSRNQKQQCFPCSFLQDRCLTKNVPDSFYERCAGLCKRRIIEEYKAKQEIRKAVSTDNGIATVKSTTGGTELRIQEKAVSSDNGIINVESTTAGAEIQDSNTDVKISTNAVAIIVGLTVLVFIVIIGGLIYCRKQISTLRKQLQEQTRIRENRGRSVDATDNPEDPHIGELSRLIPTAPVEDAEDEKGLRFHYENELKLKHQIDKIESDKEIRTKQTQTEDQNESNISKNEKQAEVTQQADPMGAELTSEGSGDVNLPDHGGEHQATGDGAAAPLPHENVREAEEEENRKGAVRVELDISINQTSNVTVQNGSQSEDRPQGRRSPLPTTSAVQVRSGSQSSGISSMSADSDSNVVEIGPIKQEEGNVSIDYNRPPINEHQVNAATVIADKATDT